MAGAGGAPSRAAAATPREEYGLSPEREMLQENIDTRTVEVSCTGGTTTVMVDLLRKWAPMLVRILGEEALATSVSPPADIFLPSEVEVVEKVFGLCRDIDRGAVVLRDPIPRVPKTREMSSFGTFVTWRGSGDVLDNFFLWARGKAYAVSQVITLLSGTSEDNVLAQLMGRWIAFEIVQQRTADPFCQDSTEMVILKTFRDLGLFRTTADADAEIASCRARQAPAAPAPRPGITQREPSAPNVYPLL